MTCGSRLNIAPSHVTQTHYAEHREVPFRNWPPTGLVDKAPGTLVNVPEHRISLVIDQS